MSDSDHVLAAIDNAINDGLSPDAMRWTPEPPEEPTARRRLHARSYGDRPPEIRIRFNLVGVEEAFRRTGEALQTVVSGFSAAGSLGRSDLQLEPGEVSGDSYARYDDGSELPEWERELIDSMEQQCDLYGNAYIEVERDD